MLASHDPTLAQTPRQYAMGMAADNAEWLKRKWKEKREMLMETEFVGTIDNAGNTSLRDETWEEIVDRMEDILMKAVGKYEQTAEG